MSKRAVSPKRLHRRLVFATFALAGLAACGTTGPATQTARPPIDARSAPGRIEPPKAREKDALPHDRFELAPPSREGARRVAVWATYYSVPVVRAVDRGGVALRDLRGRRLGPALRPRDFCDAAVEGTVRVIEGSGDARTFDFAGIADERAVDCTRWYPRFSAIGRSRFSRSTKPLGDAAHGALVPLRTIAVDPRFIPLGSVVYVPSARGVVVTLPSGDRVPHDGWFQATDTGGALRGNHVHVFLGLTPENPFPFVTARARDTFEAWVYLAPKR